MCNQGSKLSTLQVIRAAICGGPKKKCASHTQMFHEACNEAE